MTQSDISLRPGRIDDATLLAELVNYAGEGLPLDRLDVHLAHIADTKRSVALRATGPRSAELLEGFRDSLGA